MTTTPTSTATPASAATPGNVLAGYSNVRSDEMG